jgi:hypothetical protein
MATFNLENDIVVFCVTATSFPDGVLAAHQKLHSYIPFSKQRDYFGISRPEGGRGIVYKAGATELDKNELSKHGLEKFLIPKGKYLMHVLHNYRNNLAAIGPAFDELLADFRIDPSGFCLEWYVDDNTLRCLVRTAG